MIKIYKKCCKRKKPENNKLDTSTIEIKENQPAVSRLKDKK